MSGALLTLSPGLFTTVQDLGRPGHARDGISAAGAADALALRIANRLAGNPDGAAALEMTLLGGRFAFESGATFALAGADMEARLEGRPVPIGTACAAAAGQILDCGAARAGARSYLAIRGGIAVDPFLGSRSTHVPSGLGGLEGRPLRKNDRLRIGDFGGGAAGSRAPIEAAAAVAPVTTMPESSPSSAGRSDGATLRITDGAHAALFDAEARRRLRDVLYEVTAASDRMGLRLKGEAIASIGEGEILSEGMPLGAVQIPPGGQPMILFVDHQTTGGYPVIGCVISADLSRLAQLRPNDRVRFEPVSFEAARAALLEQEAWLDRVLPTLA